MKRFGNGVRSLDSNTRINFGANVLTLQTNGIKGEVVVTIKKQQYYLWRAVDCEGNVLDVLLQRHRDTSVCEAILPQTPEKTRLRATGNRHR